MGDDGLTLKQKKFAEAFLETGGRGTDAALIAGYSPASASSAAYNNLHNDDVLSAIEDRRKYAEKKLGISPFYVAKELMKWVECDNGLYALRALVELKKMFGYDAPARVELESENKHVEWVQAMIVEANKDG